MRGAPCATIGTSLNTSLGSQHRCQPGIDRYIEAGRDVGGGAVLDDLGRGSAGGSGVRLALIDR